MSEVLLGVTLGGSNRVIRIYSQSGSTADQDLQSITEAVLVDDEQLR